MSSVHLVLVLLTILAIPTQQEKACVDDITNCYELKHLCERNPHVKKMCSRTCGVCNTNSKEYQVGPNGMLWYYSMCPELARHPNSLEGCMDRCSHTDGCTAFNYVPGDNSRCELLKCPVPVPEPTWKYGQGWVGYSLISAVCSPECVNGACTAPNTCTCDQGWKGPQCQNIVCSPECVNGACTAPNTCTCDQGWVGPQCQNAVCSPECVNGACTAPNTCTCDLGWEGPQCQNAICTSECILGTCTGPNSCCYVPGVDDHHCKTDLKCGSDCQYPWKYIFNNLTTTCVLFMGVDMGTTNIWENARKACQELGADLPKFTSRNQIDGLYQFLNIWRNHDMKHAMAWPTWIRGYRNSDGKSYWADDDTEIPQDLFSQRHYHEVKIYDPATKTHGPRPTKIDKECLLFSPQPANNYVPGTGIYNKGKVHCDKQVYHLNPRTMCQKYVE